MAVQDKVEAIAAYDTLQVVAALLVGIGASLWQPIRDLKTSPDDDTYLDWLIDETALTVLILTLLLNLSALLFLSMNIFYLHQCLAKDKSETGDLYEAFSQSTKFYRTLSVRAVFNSMPMLMFVVGSLFYRETEYGYTPSHLTSIFVFAMTFFVYYVMSSTRKEWARLRKKSKEN